jgi:phospholipase/carboxylesterase
MLLYDQYVPPTPKEGAPVIVLLHGRGSHKGDLMGLQPYLPGEAIVLAPQAPNEAAPWGYGPGWAWYRHLGGNRPEPESFNESQKALQEFLGAIPRLLPVRPGPIVLGGFSQGGTMSLGYALRNPGQVDLCVNLSGFLPDHPTVEATSDSVKGTQFFWGHGLQDGIIPFALADVGRKTFMHAGAALTIGDYPMGHSIAPEELQDLVRWMGSSTRSS